MQSDGGLCPVERLMLQNKFFMSAVFLHNLCLSLIAFFFAFSEFLFFQIFRISSDSFRASCWCCWCIFNSLFHRDKATRYWFRHGWNINRCESYISNCAQLNWANRSFQKPFRRFGNKAKFERIVFSEFFGRSRRFSEFGLILSSSFQFFKHQTRHLFYVWMKAQSGKKL